MPEQSSPTGWHTVIKEYLKALPAGLPLIRVNQVPLPRDHPDLTSPELRQQDAEVKAFTDSKAELVALEKRLWKEIRNGRRPEIPDSDLLCDFIPGCEVELFLAVDMAAFELLGDDIAAMFAGVTK